MFVTAPSKLLVLEGDVAAMDAMNSVDVSMLPVSCRYTDTCEAGKEGAGNYAVVINVKGDMPEGWCAVLCNLQCPSCLVVVP